MSEYQNKLTPTEVRKICLENSLIISDLQWQLLEEWADLLLKYNQVINLISRKETDLLWEKQILHCLSLPIYRKITQGMEVCDFGTGGGLPGIILAIIRPDLHLTLVDSRQKKVSVVQNIVDDLRLSNVRVICKRGELLGKHSEWNQRFSVITARAVAPMIDLVRWTLDLRQPKSVLHILKGGEIQDEIKALYLMFKGIKINKSLIDLKGYVKFKQNQKYIISIKFSS
tara:strand:- start:2934 stop:3617 length:684 start_codon:yes stop_codon:yes gene_type:complete